MTPPKVTHVELQAQVVELLNMTGWSHLHVRRSIGRGRQWVTTTNIIGWPDLCPVWSPRQPGRVLAVELKIPPDRIRPEQAEVLASLEAAGFETHVVTPADLDRFASILTRPRAGQ